MDNVQLLQACLVCLHLLLSLQSLLPACVLVVNLVMSGVCFERCEMNRSSNVCWFVPGPGGGRRSGNRNNKTQERVLKAWGQIGQQLQPHSGPPPGRHTTNNLTNQFNLKCGQ